MTFWAVIMPLPKVSVRYLITPIAETDALELTEEECTRYASELTLSASSNRM